MGRSRRGRKICVLCSSRPDETRDHIPPKGFFPKRIRALGLVSVPACEECNGGSSDDDELFRAIYLFGEAGSTPIGTELWSEKIHRGYGENLGLRRRVASLLREREVRTPAGIYLGRKMTIQTDPSLNGRVITKLVRGFFWREFKQPLPAGARVVIDLLRTEEQARPAEQLAAELRRARDWPGVCEYLYNRVEGKPAESAWIIRLFGKYVFWAFTFFPTASAEPGPERVGAA